MIIAVMWTALGPYHAARLTAAAKHLAAAACQIVSIEIARSTATYPWQVVHNACSFRREILFPQEDYFNLNPAAVRKRVSEVLSTVNPHVVATNGWAHPESQQAIAWCRRRRRAIVVMSASKYDDAPRRWYREMVKRRIMNLCDAALVGGSPHRGYAIRLGMTPGRVFVGYDAVDNDYFMHASRRAGNTADDCTLPGLGEPGDFFLASARFVERKNLEGLLMAYKVYRQIHKAPPWRLVVLGDGNRRQAMENLIRGERIEGVTLAGFRQIDDLPAYYGRASAFVHPAHREQWGLVVNEAMACGLPVIVSEKVGCAHDLVEEGVNGWTFDPTSIEGMAHGLGRMRDLSAEGRANMGRRSREIIAGWSPERFAEGLSNAARAAIDHAHRRKRTLSLVDRALLGAYRI